MSDHVRFAVYHVPTDADLSEFGARWLGWDAQAAREVAQPDLPGIAAMTAAPRKYGFHATLKPPFRLREGTPPEALADAVAALARTLAPARSGGLGLSRLGRFLALVPEAPTEGVAEVARACVTALDGFRADPGAAELARRRRRRLTDRQEAMLQRWGYPYVLEEFRFHITLTGPLQGADLSRAEAALADRLPPLPAPFMLDRITLVGERADGRFEHLAHHALTG